MGRWVAVAAVGVGVAGLVWGVGAGRRSAGQTGPDEELTGEWRAEQADPSGLEKRTHTLRFLDDGRLEWDTVHRRPGYPTWSRRVARYEFRGDELRLEIEPAGRAPFDPPALGPGDAERVFPVRWEAPDRAAFRVRFGGLNPLYAEAVFRRATTEVPAHERPAEALARLDRSPPKLPPGVGEAKYLVMAFGPEARFRVWLADTGSAVYVDRNGNGDLADDGPPVRFARADRLRLLELTEGESRGQSQELVTHLGDVTDPHTGDRYEVVHYSGLRFGGGPLTTASLKVRRGGKPEQGSGYSPADRAEAAPILHFGSNRLVPSLMGAVTFADQADRIGIYYSESGRHVGGSPFLNLGTPGVGTRSGVGSGGDLLKLSEGVSPVAEFTFTPANPADPPISVRVVGRSQMFWHSDGARVVAPDGARAGLDMARVRVTFPGCPWGEVEPAEFTMDVIPRR
ncbi:MAG: hypothetical protein K2X82_11790 [Gemmataceae bacterium]|nr:hypothetical protein [Gemmataceae bacterium]